MPLFLRALPLSITTLWHYIFVLPLVVVVSAPFTLLTLIPLVGWPISMTIATFISLAGYRCALAAFGRGNEPSLFRLLRASFSLGLITTLAAAVMMIVAVGIGWVLIRVGFSDVMQVPPAFAVPYAGGLAAMSYLVLISVFFCAMAVPMTAVAQAATTKGRDPDPLFGFGAGLFSLLIAWGAWFAGLILLGFAATLLESIAIGLAVAVAEYTEVPLEEEVKIDWVALVIATVYFLWGTCWFCATAVLAWERRIQRRGKVIEDVVESRRVSADDLRALREARMPGSSEQL